MIILTSSCSLKWSINLVSVNATILSPQQSHWATRNNSNTDLYTYIPSSKMQNFHLPTILLSQSNTDLEYPTSRNGRWYYQATTNEVCDAKEPRTWKSICEKCNTYCTFVAKKHYVLFFCASVLLITKEDSSYKHCTNFAFLSFFWNELWYILSFEDIPNTNSARYSVNIRYFTI